MANNLAAFRSEKWSKRVLTRLDQINVMLPLVNRDYEGEIRQEGDTVWVRTFDDVTTGDYTRNLALTYSDRVPTKESMVISEAKYFAFTIDDLDDAVMDINAFEGYAQRGAVAMNNLVETKLLSKYASANAANQVTGAAAAAIAIDATNAYTTLVEAGKRLDLQNVPVGERWAVVGPTYKAALLQDDKYFIRATEAGDEIVRTGRGPRPLKDMPGYIGQCAGFNVYCSNAIPGASSTWYCQFGRVGCINYAGQIRKVERIRRESTFGTAVRGLLLHDAAVFAEQAKAFGYIKVTAK